MEWRAPRLHRLQRGDHPGGERQRTGGAHAGKHNGLDDQLARDIESTRAEREPRAQVAEAAARSRQRDGREIADADREHGKRGGPQQRERALHIPDEDVLQRFDAGVEAGAGEERLQPRRRPREIGRVHGLELLLRLRDRRPGSHAADAEPAVAVTGLVGSLHVRQRQRNPEARARIAEGEAARQDSDNRVVASSEAKRPPDDRRIGAKELAPESIGQQDARVVAGRAFAVGEDTAQCRADAQQAEEGRRGHHAGHARRHAAGVDRRDRKVVEGLLLEHGDVPEPVLVVGCRAEPAAPGLDARVLVRHQQHAIRVGHAQRVEQHGVDRRHDRGVPAEADGERDHHGRRKRRVRAQHPEAEDEVPRPAFDRQRPAEPQLLDHVRPHMA